MTKYSFLDQVAIVQGVPLSGFAEGDDVVQGARAVEAFTNVVGASGNMLVTQNANRSGTFTFRLLRGAASNAFLNALFAEQERGDFTAISVSVVNTKSGTSMIGTKGYLSKPADITMGNGAAALEWVITVENYDAIFGALEVQ